MAWKPLNRHVDSNRGGAWPSQTICGHVLLPVQLKRQAVHGLNPLLLADGLETGLRQPLLLQRVEGLRQKQLPSLSRLRACKGHKGSGVGLHHGLQYPGRGQELWLLQTLPGLKKGLCMGSLER
jgi:hypothetical protein